MSKEIEMDQNTLQPLMLESQVIKEGQHIAIKELYAAGTPKRAIARLLGIDIKTVRRQLKKADWGAYQRDNSDYKSLLEGEQEWLISRMKLKGYKGSYETVKRFVYPYREKQSKACVQFETAPGEQSQVDWGSAWVWLGDTEVKVHF